MKYILYSPPHDITAPGFTKANGEAVPEKVFHTGARALYRHSKYRDRRYRQDYPYFGADLKLLVCDTMEAAVQEQKRLKEYSNEVFEIRPFEKGRMLEVKQ